MEVESREEFPYKLALNFELEFWRYLCCVQRS